MKTSLKSAQQAFTDSIERAVLDALDAKMNLLVHGSEDAPPYKVGDTIIEPKSAGWWDEDLNVLLPAIRKHAEALWVRYDLTKHFPE